MFRKELMATGYRLRSPMSHAGAAVGIGAHRAIAEGCTANIMSGDWPTGRAIADIAAEVTGTILRGEARYDDSTPNRGAAQSQARRIGLSFIEDIAPVIKPLEVETHLKGTLASGARLSGHTDIGEEGGLDDIKTGVTAGTFGAQIGGYLALRKLHGRAIGWAREIHIPRTNLRKEQPKARVIDHDPEVALKSAAAIVKAIERDLAEFRRTGDPYAFPANPSSILCSEKYCPAYGTDFCKEGRKR